MKNTVLVLTIALSATAFTACNNAENSSNKMAEKENDQKFENNDVKKDAEFAMKAASGGMMEVELGQWAATNGASDGVRQFGQNMVTDHSKANDELKALAQAKSISLPAQPDNDMQKKINDLKEKKGADFDKAYVDMMVSDHKDDIDLFQKEADKGNDADVKSWAAGKIPVLQHHLQMIEEMQKSMKK